MKIRDLAIQFGMAAAAKQFDGRKGHGGSARVVHRQLSEADLAALMAVAFEKGYEFCVTKHQLEARRG